MFGIGTGELLLLLVLALLVLGPERMPRLARDIGKTVGDLRRTSEDLKQEFLSADTMIDRAARIGEPVPATPSEAGAIGGPVPVTPTEAGAIAEPPQQPTHETLPAAAPESLPGGAAEAKPAEGASGERDTVAGATQADVVAPDPDETAFDRDARLARERLDDPARAERAKAEGWTVPTDEAGANSDRWS